jgi:hypothetical protein
MPTGVMLKWSANGFPSWNLADQPGQPIIVSGRTAKISMQSRVCDGLGADQQVSVVVSRNPADNWYELDGCFRDPGSATAVADVLALLQTVRIKGP